MPRKRICDLTPEEIKAAIAREAEHFRERRKEADRLARPALRRLIESMEEAAKEGEQEKEDK